MPVFQPKPALLNTIQEIEAYLSNLIAEPSNFEILLCLNPVLFTAEQLVLLKEIRTKFKNITVLDHFEKDTVLGKGAALKRGFQNAKGQFIFFTDDDLPYDLSFIKSALYHLKQGKDFVVGSRRNIETVLELSESCEKFYFKRSILSLAFNKIYRSLFGLKCRDTQAGIKAYSRNFAEKAFSLQKDCGYIFDVEHFVIAKNTRSSVLELPVIYRVKSNETTVNLWLEFPKALYKLFFILIKNSFGFYSIQPQLLHQKTKTSAEA